MHLKKDGCFVVRFVEKKDGCSFFRLLKKEEKILPTDEILTKEKPTNNSLFESQNMETLSVMDNQDRNYLKIR